ncbi:hypothetical protein [Streptomyces sp. A1547]|uniref:Pyrroline-5-carboxylate reductase catalytic N-terminal domain-containing protein n=1 Tax=Streptomyces sp. R33 TaxID=3238629 RepID=A0AB39YE78_9ACTN
MKIAVLGTGGGARPHIARLAELGHQVLVGTRDPQATLARTEPDMMGIEPFKHFLADHPGIERHTFGDAAAASDRATPTASASRSSAPCHAPRSPRRSDWGAGLSGDFTGTLKR